MPEWLSGMTRNHVGFARAGSNPADHAPFYFVLQVPILHTTPFLCVRIH